jgi:hypothetical protein
MAQKNAYSTSSEVGKKLSKKIILIEGKTLFGEKKMIKGISFLLSVRKLIDN